MKNLNFQNYLAESKASSIDQFHNLFKKYEFYKELDNVKQSAVALTFVFDDKKYKIETMMGELTATANGKKVFDADFDSIGQDLVDSVVDKLDPKLKNSKLEP